MEGVRTAEELLKAGQPRRAAVTASKALAKLKQGGTPADVVSALEILVRAQCMNQDAEKSIATLKEFKAVFREKSDKKCEVLVTCLEAECYLAKSSVEDALSCVEIGLEMARAERDRTGEASALRTKAKCLTQTGETDEAITLGRTVAAILRETKDYEGESLELLSVSELHFYLAQYGECVTAARRAAKLFEELGHIQAQATALTIGAEAARAQGILRHVSWQAADEGALPMATAALQLYEQAGIVDGQMQSRSRIASVLFQMGNFDEAAHVAEAAVGQAMLVGNRAIMGEALATRVKAILARINMRQSTATAKSVRQWADSAVEAALQLETLWGETITDKGLQSEAKLHTANALFTRSQALNEKTFDDAFAAAARSLEIAQEAKLQKQQADALCLEAQIHFAAQNINAAADRLESARAMYKENMHADGLDNAEALYRKFRSSYLWSKRKVRAEARIEDYGIDQLNAAPNKWDYAPKGARGLNGYVHVHFDNLMGRAARNIG